MTDDIVVSGAQGMQAGDNNRTSSFLTGSADDDRWCRAAPVGEQAMDVEVRVRPAVSMDVVSVVCTTRPSVCVATVRVVNTGSAATVRC